VQSIKNGLHTITGKVTGMFGDLTHWMGGAWTSMSNWMNGAFNMMLVGYDSAVLKVKILKDDLEEMKDRLFDGIVDYFDGVWDKMVGMLPDSVKNALGIKEKETVERRALEKPSKELAKSVAPASVPSDPLGGDGKNKADVVKPTAPTPDPQEGRKAIVINGSVDLAGMNPGLMDNFYSMAAEFHKLTGKKVGVNSGKRSAEKQAALHAANPAKAAKPGYSMHEFGLAIDINSADANMMESMGLFKKYGFVRPISNEAWHIEPLAIQGMKSAIRRGKEEAVIAKTGGGSDVAKSKIESEGAPTDAQVAATPLPAKTDTAKSGASAVAPTAAQGATVVTGPPAPLATPTTVAAAPTNGPAMKPMMPSVTEPKKSSLADQSVATLMPSAAILPESVAAPTSIAGDVEASIAPSASSAYDAVASRSKRIDTTFDPAPPEQTVGVASRTTAKTSSNHIPFYLGDMGMLTLNLGVGA
jgi:hypothetical protein